MKQIVFMFIGCLLFAGTFLLTQCSEKGEIKNVQQAGITSLGLSADGKKADTNLQQQIELGEHLVIIAGCHDCHSPKKMTAKGMEIDYANALSGHPAKMPPPDVNRADIEKKGLVVTQTLTSWVGPWGISYAANLTPDKTGIGTWQESNFITAIRQGKFKGLPNGRNLLPPMPWDMYRNMTDEELKAIFAYLKSIKPVQNVVPAAAAPVLAKGPAKK